MEEEPRRASQSADPGSCSAPRRFQTVPGGDVWKQLTAPTVAQTRWFGNRRPSIKASKTLKSQTNK